MTIEAKTDAELEELKRKIVVARRWARKHFNADNCSDARLVDDDLNLVKPSWFVDFPSPDRMIAEPSIMGRRAGIAFEYRLHFAVDGGLFWTANNPLTGARLPPLIVMEATCQS